MRRFKIFGFHIEVSRQSFRTKPLDKNCNAFRNSQRNKRLEMTGHKCEVCGQPIDKTCHIHHTLPAGTEGRNAVENIRVMCGKCWHELEKKPHILGYQQLEDEHGYEDEDEYWIV